MVSYVCSSGLLYVYANDRDATKKAADATANVRQLKLDMNAAKQRQNKPESTGGGLISKWATQWLHSKGITSKVYHGGDWEGNSCRRFLIGEGKRPAVYADFICELTQQIAAIDVSTQHKNEEKKKLTTFLNGVFKNCCAGLAPVVKYLTATTEFSEQECDAAGAACKGYVQFLRSHLSEIRKVIKSANVKPKMHVLEQHVPEWLEEWCSVGFFGEDVVESLHAEINELQRRFVVDWSRNKKRYMQSVDDEMNLRFHVFARAIQPHLKDPAKKKPRLDAGGSEPCLPPAEPVPRDQQRRIRRHDL